MEYIIYKIKLDEKPEYIYVGSTKDFNHRKCVQKCRSNLKHNIILYNNTINENGGWDM